MTDILGTMSSIDTDNISVLTPDVLFHTVLIMNDNLKGTSGPTHSMYILGTHDNLEAAKSYAIHSLRELDFIPDYFDEYFDRTNEGLCSGNGDWVSDNGVQVFAPLPSGPVLTISIHATLNTESRAATPKGELILPGGAKFLHYVLHTTINTDHTATVQTTKIEGTYVHRADAWSAAHKCLNRPQYIKYSDQSDADVWGHWPYGKEVVIHAVSTNGENHYVAVKVPVWADTAQKRRLLEAVA